MDTGLQQGSGMDILEMGESRLYNVHEPRAGLRKDAIYG